MQRIHGTVADGVEQVAAETRYHRQRYDRYRARMYAARSSPKLADGRWRA